MAATGFDGTIRIDTKVDSKGFNAGVKNINNSMKGMLGSLKVLAIAAAAAGAAITAIGIAAGIAFGRAAINAASEISSAYIGLKSVVEGMGRSFVQTKKFIQDYIKDGLVPAADAVTAYKNLLMRGYSTEQIERVMLALKDSAAFGRQSSLTIGQAVKSATEGLKNENSILVDNAGVTKNVSMMWKDYAETLNKGVGSLTKAEKIQAEVNGIMEETRFQTGDAAKAANTYSGQVASLNVSLTNLKVSIGNILIPFVQKFIPIIKSAFDALAGYFGRIATLVALFFGVDLDETAAATAAVTDETSDAATAQDDLAKATTKAGKAAKGALAAFDELNVLQRNSGETTEETPEPIVIPELDTEAVDVSLQSMQEKVLQFKEELLRMLAPAGEAFNRLKEQLAPLGEMIRKGLGWAWENVLVPFGRWAAESFLPRFLDMMAAGVRLLNAALVVLNPVFSWLFENILKPFAAVVGWVILNSIEGWTKAFNALASWLESHPDLFANFGQGAIDTWDRIQSVWSNAGLFFSNLLSDVVGIFTTKFTTVRDVIDGIKITLNGILTFIKGVFAGDWEMAWNGMTEVFKGIVYSWTGIFKGVFNTVIDLVNGLLDTMASAINSVIGMVNSISVDIPEWVPFYGGNSWNLSIPSVSAPSIPKLASGAVIPPNSEFAAILGDQRSGKNLEAPESLIRQIVREEMGSIKGEFTFVFDGTLGALVRELKPRLDKENIRIGNSLVKGSNA